MERISEYVYFVLNRDIGCEEEVYIKRRLFYYSDKIFNVNNKHFHGMMSGSRGEGFDMEGSDVDVMTIFKNITVLTEGQTLPCDIIMESSNIKPGFARLRLQHNNNIYNMYADTFTSSNDHVYMSSLFFRDSFIGEGDYGHGPCSTYDNGRYETDYAYCLSCRNWPNEASEWVHRYRPNNWPSDELVNEIVNGGILLVPICNPLSPTSHMEWRMSFSVAEKKLVHSMSHTQFLCYGLLKIFLKHIININDFTKDLLCSYFMKTVLFYVIESEPLTWQSTNLLTCFWRCLKRLYIWVREGFCPNYFVKDNNMFEHKVYGEYRSNLLEYLSALYEDQLCTLLRIPIFNNLPAVISPIGELAIATVQLSDGEMEFCCFFECLKVTPTPGTDINTAISSLLTLSTEPVTCQFDIDVLYMMKVAVKFKLTQLLYQKYINECTISSNKSNYRYLSKIRKYIKHNCTHGDICTGLLQYATLCYLTGQYSTVIPVVKYVFSKFQPYTMYLSFTHADCPKNLFIQAICNRGLSFIQKLKQAVASYQTLNINCGFYPPEIHNVLQNHLLDGHFHPVVYCYALLFLSYNSLSYTELRNQTLHDFTLAIQDKMLERELAMCLDLLETFRSIIDLSSIHDKYVVIPADKASNNIVFICKSYYYKCLMEELDVNNNQGNPTYTPTALLKEEIVQNHKSALASFNIQSRQDSPDLPSLHKNVYN